jgi:hypothetical protein
MKFHNVLISNIDKKKEKRKREAERDEEDRQKEAEEIRIEEEKRIEEQKKIEEEKRKAEERKRRPKSRFTEIKDPKAILKKNDSQASDRKLNIEINLPNKNLQNNLADAKDKAEIKEEAMASVERISLRVPNTNQIGKL